MAGPRAGTGSKRAGGPDERTSFFDGPASGRACPEPYPIPTRASRSQVAISRRKEGRWGAACRACNSLHAQRGPPGLREQHSCSPYGTEAFGVRRRIRRFGSTAGRASQSGDVVAALHTAQSGRAGTARRRWRPAPPRGVFAPRAGPFSYWACACVVPGDGRPGRDAHGWQSVGLGRSHAADVQGPPGTQQAGWGPRREDGGLHPACGCRASLALDPAYVRRGRTTPAPALRSGPRRGPGRPPRGWGRPRRGRWR